LKFTKTNALEILQRLNSPTNHKLVFRNLGHEKCCNGFIEFLFRFQFPRVALQETGKQQVQFRLGHELPETHALAGRKRQPVLGFWSHLAVVVQIPLGDKLVDVVPGFGVVV